MYIISLRILREDTENHADLFYKQVYPRTSLQEINSGKEVHKFTANL